MVLKIAAAGLPLLAAAGFATMNTDDHDPDETVSPGPRFAHLGRPDGDPSGMARVRELFRARNPGYDLEYRPELDGFRADATLVLFIQSGEATGVVRRTGGEAAASSDLILGDMVLLRADETFEPGGELGAVVFRVPEELPADMPSILRPDWDPTITDTPGGCATEEGAYRRVLVTWEEKNGPYRFHALNAHRVRMTDGFTHYHPVDGGFDEFYLVQGNLPRGQVITSTAVAKISRPESVTREEAGTLLQTHELAVGDLAYYPRGTIHRGLGGALAHVITVPGFRPGAEIGVDHHLARINELLQLTGENALPFNREHSAQQVIK